MRITNNMTTNRLLLNLNRNATTVDRLMMQLTTGKRIQNPSDNPIIASRALRFRTNVSEVQQFQRNADKATSWMEVTEQALRNMTDLMERINELLVQGASSTYTYQNRQTIAREIEMMFDQINQEMNGTFAGRHVFSGFRTDIPPIAVQNNLTNATNTVDINITKMITNLDFTDVGVAFWRDPANPNRIEVVATYEWLNRPDRVPADWETNPDMTLHIIGAPPTTPAAVEFNFPIAAGDSIVVDGVTITFATGAVDDLEANAYLTDPAVVAALAAAGITAVAGATGITFTTTAEGAGVTIDTAGSTVAVASSTDGTTGQGQPYGINIMRLPYQARYDDNGILIRDVTPPAMIGTLPVTVHSLAGGTNPYIPVSGEIIFIRETGEFIVHTDNMYEFEVAGGLNVTYNIDGIFQGELEPRVFFEMHDAVTNQTFTQAYQDLMFELGASTRLAVNSRAQNAYPWQFFAEMSSMLHWVNNAHSTNAVSQEQQLAERSFFIESLHTKFTNFIGQMERHVQTTATEFTTLGSRMNRVELIATRLDENEDTFMALMSQNENVDYIEALMRFNAAEAVLQAAMQVGARIAQISLVNFI